MSKGISSPFSASAYITQNGNAPVKADTDEPRDFRYHDKGYLAFEAELIAALRHGATTLPELKRTLRPANLQFLMDGLAKVAHEDERTPLNIYTLNESEAVEPGAWNNKNKGKLVL